MEKLSEFKFSTKENIFARSYFWWGSGSESCMLRSPNKSSKSHLGTGMFPALIFCEIF